MEILDITGRADALDGLPATIGGLCEVAQGLLVHDAAALYLYGDAPAGFVVSRETKPVAERIDAALTADPAPLTVARPVFARQVGTCRDFAAMLCAFARHRGFDARVRCGYALYLGGERPEDHWVVEYRDGASGPWRLADAQMDAAHRAALGLAFDHADMPRSAFVGGDDAWRLWRGGGAPAERFGHGAHRGERFLFVNLARDALARSDALRSRWDGWRDLGALDRPLSAEATRAGDALCAGEREALALVAGGGPDMLAGARP